MRRCSEKEAAARRLLDSRHFPEGSMERKDKVEVEADTRGPKDYNERTKKCRVRQGGAARATPHRSRARTARQAEGRAHRQEAREGAKDSALKKTT